MEEPCSSTTLNETEFNADNRAQAPKGEEPIQTAVHQNTFLEQTLMFYNTLMPSMSVQSGTGNWRRIRKGAEFQSFDEFAIHFKAWKDKFFHPFRIYNSDKFKLANGDVHPIFKVRAVSYHCSRYGQPRPRGQLNGPRRQARQTKHLACGCRAGLRLVYSSAGNCLRITTFNESHNGHDADEGEYRAIVNKQYKALFGRGSNQQTDTTPVSRPDSVPPANPIPFPMMNPVFPISISNPLLGMMVLNMLTSQSANESPASSSSGSP